MHSLDLTSLLPILGLRTIRKYQVTLKAIALSSDLSQPKSIVSRINGEGCEGSSLRLAWLVGEQVALFLLLVDSSELPVQSRVFI